MGLVNGEMDELLVGWLVGGTDEWMDGWFVCGGTKKSMAI